MKKIYFSLIVVSAFCIGCGSIPSCDDKEVTDVVTQIVKKQVPNISSLDISYSGFMTEKIDKEKKLIRCKGEMKMTNKDTKQSAENWFDYSARYTDDGMVYVEVY
ncbi:hypothetical protein AVBRAN12640_07730 [Campylobacter sp. RM12640]|uniref:hypothetical protein n=1 Tax=unclassified Campylobacter TaxID=2593542 RepID=UPI0030152F40|nr:hypothetical protein [Campylobacter sp. RM12640]MBZ7989605.1 hypothetical protein [Campylobacter sp. RM12635]